MNFPSDHPVWKIIRYAVVSLVMIIGCATLYKNGFDAKDTILILTTIAGLAGFDEVKKQITKE